MRRRLVSAKCARVTTIGWTAALWLLGSLLLHADAPAPPVVASVIVSSATTPQQITITGSDFGNVMPSLSMDGFDLHVTNFTSTVVRAELPALITSHPGTYVLTLDKNSGPPPFRTVSIDVAIGAVGPQGPPGGTGLPGPQGAQGPPGPNVLAPGSAAAPSLSFAGDAATGFFSAGINTVNITTMGTNRLTIRPDGDLDLPGSIRKNGSLFLHNLGSSNTAIGVDALSHDTSGSSNSAVGREALAQNTTGASNTAVGTGALGTNKGGGSNTAVGVNALAFIATGDFNTALGKDAMFTATGSRNIALGDFALGISTGDRNIAIGDGAGALLTSGHDNVYIANSGAASESNTIRLGLTQNRTFVAGVAGTALSNSAPVLIDTSTGQLGTLVSSRRYKEDIQDMGDASANLQRLRPVTFHYRNAPAGESKPLEYGLIAEEVEETYPDLVAHGSEGQVETVQYHKLIPMLLNELQKQARVIRWLEEKVEALEAQHSNGFAGRR